MTALVLSMAVAIAAPVPVDKKADEEFEKKVAPAREKAIKFLKEKQDKEGGWEDKAGALTGFEGGQTALAALALLEAGVPANDPVLEKAIKYLLALKPDKTYVVSLQTQVLARADTKKYAKEIQANADWLLKNAIKRKDKLVGWSYPGNDIADASNTHFAVMALHAAAQAGAKVDAELWRQIRDLYAKTQQQDGGWVYHNAGGNGPSHSMTVAGLLGLAVAVKYDKDAKGQDPAFEKGMTALLGDKLGKFGDGKSTACSWMATAELGRALGSTEFKSGKLAKAWYREGCESMIKLQQADGSFVYPGDAPGIDKGYPVITTACGLFLLGPPPKK